MMGGNKREIGKIGTIVRIILGVVLILFGFNSPIAEIISRNQINFWENYFDDMLIGIFIIPLVLVLWQWIRNIKTSKQLRATGNKGVIINTLIIVFLFYTPLHHAMWFYLGFSLLVAAWRGYAGCEVLAIANWITGRNDQVGCVILSPIDNLEKKEHEKTNS